MKTTATKPFWETMHNPITMHKVTRQDDPKKSDYNKKYYKKNNYGS